MSRIVLYIIGLLFVFAASPGHAQPVPLPKGVPVDTVVTLYLPVAAYSSDLGLIGGLAFNRYRYHPDATPFLSLTEVFVQASTKGMISARIRYEHTELLNRSIRSRIILYGERHPKDYYFGMGNQTTFDSDAWSDDFYAYKVKHYGLRWMGRKTVYRPARNGGHLDLTGTLETGYEIPGDSDERLIGQDRPTGIDGGWVHAIGLGSIWENRDSEFAATRGNRMELSGEWVPGLLPGNFSMASVFSEFRQYVTLPVPWLHPVLAFRLAGKWTTGTVPYWKRPYLGDEKTLRGYPLYRFRGDASVFYNVELRTWIFEYERLDFKLGVHGFHDAGRVFYGDDGFDQLLQNYHRTYGGGIATALFTPDFILRLDVGFSDEMYRLYMNIGYMF